MWGKTMQKQPWSRRSRRAIFLISVLFFALLIAMFVEAALVLAPSGFARASNDASLSKADQASKSGIDWARTRISADPTWVANTTATFVADGLRVQEGNGIVVGWVQQNNDWIRFRLRFNYQDGPASASLDSDNLDDPATSSMLTDFPYVSCNNLEGGSARSIPLAASGSSFHQSTPWANTQLTLPAATLLLSVEGASGTVSLDASGNPTDFSGAIHRKTIQTMLKLGSNQPIADGAIMSAGDLNVSLMGTSALQLNSTVSSQTSRLRTKTYLNVGNSASSNGGNVTSTKAELRAASTSSMTYGTLSSGITTAADTGGFYQIPASKVRQPSGSLSLPAGTYVVSQDPTTHAGKVTYYDMDYATYAAATPAPVGTPTSLPSAMTITGPNPTGPKFQITMTSDLKITPGISATDFALIPDGGAAQSSNYGGVASSTPAPADDPSGFLTFLNPQPGFFGDPLNGGTVNRWRDALQAAGYTSSPGLLGYQNFTFPDGTILGIPPNSGGQLYMGQSVLGLPAPGGSVSTLQSVIAHVDSVVPAKLQDVESRYPAFTPGSASPSASPSASASPTALLPADLQLNMQGSSDGLVLGSKQGNIIIGAQIQGNGAAIVSSGNISLIGTSSDLNSNAGTAMGLNLYSQGVVTIDAYKLDPSGTASFHGVKLQGVVYAWNGINILAGKASGSAPFSLQGSMVAYGGDPTLASVAGSAPTNITAQSATLTFDPSYVVNLVRQGPFALTVLSWHEF